MEDAVWIKSNLHCHSANSPDGEVPVDDLCRWYAERGYGLLAITDHNSVTDLGASPSHPSLVLVPRSVEIGGQTENILAIGIREYPSAALTAQEILDAIGRQGGMAILAHPNWRWNHWTADDLMGLHGYAGIEIVNTHMRECEGHENALHLFDEILLRGKRVLAFGNDDAHNICDERIIGQAWNEIQVAQPTLPDLMQAIRAGRFYVSTGARIRAAGLADGCFSVECPTESRITFIVNGERVWSGTGRHATYTLGRGARYIRAEVETPQGHAYTQAAFPDPTGC